MTEPSTVLTVAGLGVIAVTVGLLIWGKVSPIVAMVAIPIVGALLAGFSIADISGFFEAGVDRVMNVVVMFIFAIVFFGILSDAGLFAPVVRGLILLTRGRVVAVAVGTALIGVIAHLDGAGATTFLLTIPALLPLYLALHMSRYLLLLLISLSAGIMNMVPWGGPLGRAAAVTNIDPVALYQPLIPLQGVGIVLIVGLAILLGLRESRRIRKGIDAGDLSDTSTVDVRAIADEFSAEQAQARLDLGENARSGRWVLLANAVLALAVLALMLAGVLPPAFAFMIGVALALLLNFRTADAQMARLRAHAPNALMMAAVILAAAVFLGVLNESGMLESVALSTLAVIPAALGPNLHVAMGLIGVPMDLLTSTDAYYFSVLPLVDATAGHFGVPTASTAHAMMIGNVIGTFVSPFSPALWLGVGLAGASMGQHIRYSFLLVWAFSVVLLLAAVIMGIVTVG